jgi:chromosome segregation ATPase
VQRTSFDPTSAPGLAADLGGFFREPAPGSAVTLHEEDGKVVYYSVAATDPATQQLRASIGTLSESLQAKDTQIQQLRTTLENQQATLSDVATLKTSLADAQTLLAQRETELGTLRSQVADLQRAQTELTTAASPDRVKAIETELEDLRSFRSQVTQFMQQRPPGPPK